MDLRTPHRIALLIAVCSALAVALGFAAFGRFHGLSHAWLPFAILGPVTGAATYVIAVLLIRRFVQDRVDLIHRTIHEARTGTSSTVQDLDPLGRVNEEVVAWADSKRTEITELKERERFRREFMGNLAHELRTPIFSIQGYILTLLDGGLEDVRINRDFLERANNGVERLIRIVEDLDMITELESGVMAMEPACTDLERTVDEAIESLEMLAREKKLILRNDLDEGTLVLGDHDRLLQVFVNLFNNAVNYGHEGGLCTVRSFVVGDHVRVEVADNGSGIAPEHLTRLFERFYRVGKSRSRNEGGSGLGLAIVKHIVESHGGTITVDSTEGKGTTFAITLPKYK